MSYYTIPVGLYQVNCYLISVPASRTLYVIDPGAEPEKILNTARKLDFDTARILLTHAHFDHIGAAAAVGRALGVKEVELSAADHIIYSNKLNSMLPDYPFDPDKLPATEIRPSADFTLLKLPGHSPGGSGFLFKDGAESVLFCGDSLFAGSIGRTDLWGGDMATLLKALRQEVLSLDDNVIVCPGHDESSTVGIERRTNMYLQ